MIFIDNLQGTLVTIQNNGNRECELSQISIEETIGSELQDRFNVQAINVRQGFTIPSGENITLRVSPTGFTGIVANGELVVQSTNCQEARSDLVVDIIFSNIVLDNINIGVDAIITFFENLINIAEDII